MSHDGQPARLADDSPLNETWPSFLDRFDPDPDGAFTDFFDFANRMLAACPPRLLYQVGVDDREDLLHDIILHCCRDGFRVLRSYRNRGKPFAAWFMLVARNRILDHLRKRRGTAVALAEEVDDDQPGVVLTDDTPGADRLTDRKRLIALVQDTLHRMSDECRTLLQGAAEGFKPRELTRLMGWPSDWNKKASDDLRECRKRLRGLLGRQGLNEGELRGLFTS